MAAAAAAAAARTHARTHARQQQRQRQQHCSMQASKQGQPNKSNQTRATKQGLPTLALPVPPTLLCRRGLLLVRGVVGFFGVSCYYWAVQLLPMTDVAALSFLAPVLVAAAAPLVLGERAGRGVLLALPLCVAGVVLVAQPTMLFGQGAQALSMLGVAVGIAQASNRLGRALTSAAVCLGAAGASLVARPLGYPCKMPPATRTGPLPLTQAAGSAGAKLCVRSLRTEAVSSVVFSMALVSTLGSGALCALLPRHFVVPPTAGVWALLLAAGLLACGVQFLATLSLKLSKATPAVAMSYFAGGGSLGWPACSQLLPPWSNLPWSPPHPSQRPASPHPESFLPALAPRSCVGPAGRPGAVPPQALAPQPAGGSAGVLEQLGHRRL